MRVFREFSSGILDSLKDISDFKRGWVHARMIMRTVRIKNAEPDQKVRFFDYSIRLGIILELVSVERRTRQKRDGPKQQMLSWISQLIHGFS
jgi:hypothetical protein